MRHPGGAHRGKYVNRQAGNIICRSAHPAYFGRASYYRPVDDYKIFPAPVSATFNPPCLQNASPDPEYSASPRRLICGPEQKMQDSGIPAAGVEKTSGQAASARILAVPARRFADTRIRSFLEARREAREQRHIPVPGNRDVAYAGRAGATACRPADRALRAHRQLLYGSRLNSKRNKVRSRGGR